MITLERVAARVGHFELHDITLTVERGVWAVLLGPAGAGKTTLLEIIAGVRPLADGRVLLRNVDVTAQPAELRRVGLMYQHAFLFPHLSVRANVAYGAAAERAEEIAATLGVQPLLDRAVHSLSGGERQLVALARALAPDPDILLLDEPFTALDPRRRTQVRSALRRLQRERGMTVLQVTHDFVEAGLLGDQAIVLDAGRVQQVATPTQLFRAPANAIIAGFVGIENVFSGYVTTLDEPEPGESATLQFSGEGLELSAVGSRTAGPAHAVVRAEDVTLGTAEVATSARNVLRGIVEEVLRNGVLARVEIRIGETMIVALVTSAAVDELKLTSGSVVTASIKATNVHLC